MRFKYFRMVLITAAITAFVLYVANYYWSSQSLVEHGQEDSQGEAIIGGDFTLIDQDGKVRHSAEFHGKYILVYFGYTFCPDICPMGLHSLTEALNVLSPQKRAMLQPLFISIDPNRDRPAELKNFVKQFHPSLIGLTGEEEPIKDIMKKYHVYGVKQSPQHEAAYYVMDHSSIFYMMDPSGKYIGHFTHATSPQEMAKLLARWIKG